MKIYLAGPMTDIPQFNIPMFDHAAEYLRWCGYEVVSPAELDDPETRRLALLSPDGAPGSGTANGETWGDFLSRDVKLIADEGIEAVVVLPGWEDSKGARLETFVAVQCGLPVYAYDDQSPNLLSVPPFALNYAHGQAQRLDEDNRVLFDPIDHRCEDHPDRVTATGAIHDDVPLWARMAKGQVSWQNPPEITEGEFDQLMSVLTGPCVLPEYLTDEVRITDEKTGGQKGQKLAQLGALDPLSIMEVAKVAGFGGQKYDRFNFTKGYNYSLSYDAMQRHLLLWAAGEERDEESHLPHLAHAAWHCLALMTFQMRDKGTDDRLHQMEWMA